MKILAISDLHGFLPPILPEVDVLIIAGDICPDNSYTLKDDERCALKQERWLEKQFAPWVKNQPAKEKLMIWGNHDFVGQNPVTEDTTAEILADVHVAGINDRLYRTNQGLLVYGHPWVPNNESWAFHKSNPDLALACVKIPTCDILVSHGPARGVLDYCTGGNVGSVSLRERVYDLKPSIHIFGHIHASRGEETWNGTRAYNVSYVDERYLPWNLPLQEITLHGQSGAIEVD